MRVVRSIWRKAPDIGAVARIYCGVGSTDGRAHYAVVGGKGDRLRKCRIVGYRIDVFEGGVDLLVKVKMNLRHQLIQRVHESHVNCLEGGPR